MAELSNARFALDVIRHHRSLLSRAAVALAVAVALGLAASPDDGSATHVRRAAIVDQLSASVPNPLLIQSTTDMLEEAGYRVDYYAATDVTVDFYRTLPARGYGIIVLRIHSGLIQEIDPDTNELKPRASVTLFTSEPYSRTKYLDEQDAGRLGWSRYFQQSDSAVGVFGVAPAFIKHSMRGRFPHTLVLMMGCSGMASTGTAQAFLDKGAEAYVGWSQNVSAPYTDAATEAFLHKLLVDNLSVREAVAETSAEVGPDPLFGATLAMWPGTN